MYLRRVAPCFVLLLISTAMHPIASHAQASAGATPAAEPKIVEGRFTVKLPTQPLRLGEENPIEISRRGPSLEHLDVVQV